MNWTSRVLRSMRAETDLPFTVIVTVCSMKPPQDDGPAAPRGGIGGGPDLLLLRAGSSRADSARLTGIMHQSGHARPLLESPSRNSAGIARNRRMPAARPVCNAAHGAAASSGPLPRPPAGAAASANAPRSELFEAKHERQVRPLDPPDGGRRHDRALRGRTG